MKSALFLLEWFNVERLLLLGAFLIYCIRWLVHWNKKEIPLVILLVRHCQSTANSDPSVYETLPDHAIPLSNLGISTTLSLGSKITKYLEGRFPCCRKRKTRNIKCKLLISPFRRTRETASLLLKTDLAKWVTEVQEEVVLVEQDWGIFEGGGIVRGKELYPREYEHLQTQKRWRGKYWARMPMGESAFDVCQRVSQLFSSILKWREGAADEGSDAQVVIVVSHGITSRAFIMMWQHYSPEWFDSSYNFANGAVHCLDSDLPQVYAGGIIGGFDSEGNEQPPQAAVPDPVQTHSNEVYYTWCTTTRYADTQYVLSSMHKSSKRAAMLLEETTGTRAKQLFSGLAQSRGQDSSSSIFYDTTESEQSKIPFSEASLGEKG